MSNKAIEEKVIELMHLSKDIINIPCRGKNTSEVASRLSWAKTRLKNWGLIKNTSRGKWIINQKNLNIETIDFKSLLNNGIYNGISDLKDIFVVANNEFLKKELGLLKSDVSEICICATLKGYFEKKILGSKKYKDYYVDVNYNRNAGHIKTIIDGDLKVIKVTCDLIIHSRGENEQQDNLLALEMKKSYRPENEKESDKERLMAFTKPFNTNDTWSYDGKTFPKYVCGYLLGIYYEIDLPNNRIIVEYFRLSKCIEQEYIYLE